MTLGLLLAFAGVAVADIIQADADGDTVAVSSNESLTLQPGASVVRNISFQLVCGRSLYWCKQPAQSEAC